jgi:hypothetical protein
VAAEGVEIALTYRPQFAYPSPPPGWQDEEFEYYFDSTNTPALAMPPVNQVPLILQADAEYRIRAFQMSGNTGPLGVRFWSARGDPLSLIQVESDLAYASTVQGGPPVGRLPVPLNDEIICPAGSSILVDLVELNA